MILVTAHRRENFGEPIIRVCEALRRLAQKYGDRVRLVYPVHRNPNIWDPVHRLLNGIPNIILRDPLEYLPLVHLMKRSYLVLTDSGEFKRKHPHWHSSIGFARCDGTARGGCVRQRSFSGH